MTTLFLTAVILLSSVEVRVTTLGGEQAQGELAEINANRLKILTGDSDLTVPLSDVVTVVIEGPHEQPSVPSAWLRLMDGSRLALARFTMKSADIQAVFAVPGQVRLDRRAVRAVRWLDEESARLDRDFQARTLQRWEELCAAAVTADRVVIRRAPPDQQGAVTLRALNGVIHAVDEHSINFEFRGKRLDVTRRNKVNGLIFYQPAFDVDSTELCQVVDLAGSVLRVRALSSATGQEPLRVETVSGATVELPWSAIRQIDFSKGKIVYLSDLEPESVEWTPLIGAGHIEHLLARLYTPRRDQGFNAQPLHLEINGKQRTFAKGLALHSRTEIAYRLNGDFRRFQALAGLNPQLGSRGHVQLTIFGDDAQIFESEVRGGTEPLTLDVDITGVRRLRILVDYGDNLDVADHLFLCDGKVTK